MIRLILTSLLALPLFGQAMFRSQNRTTASPPPVTCSGYAYYSSLTLPTPGSTLTDFPIVYRGTLADIKTTANGGHVEGTDSITDPYSHAVPADFILKDTDGTTTISNFEWGQYSASAGTYELWIKYPSLTTGGGTIYACYGNAAVTTFQGNVNGTWNSNFKLIDHLPDGTTLSAGDSTSSANDGTITGAVAVAGKIDGAASFNGSSDHITKSGTIPSLNVIDKTIEAWVYIPTSISGGWQTILEIARGTENWYGLFKSGAATTFHFRWAGVGGTVADDFSSTISANTWYHVVGTLSGTTATFYLNGAQDKQLTGVAVPNSEEGSMNIGLSGDGAEGLPGYIDEVRVSSGARSADWIAASYANQNTAATISAATHF